MKALRLLFASAVLLGVASVTTVHAQDLGLLRTRMEQRVGQIDELKKAGIIGETNRGFLEVRSGDDKGVAAAENADRTAVYAAISKKAGTSAEAVGKARAKQIAAGSAAGVWVQGEDGKWVKK